MIQHLYFCKIKTATEVAEAMVKLYGMSEKVGFRVHNDYDKREYVSYSTSTKELIDSEVKRLLQVFISLQTINVIYWLIIKINFEFLGIV